MSITPRPYPQHTPGPPEWTSAHLVEHLQLALHVELSTIPLYLYAMWSIKTDTKEGQIAASKIRRQSHLLNIHAAAPHTEHAFYIIKRYLGSGDAAPLTGG